MAMVLVPFIHMTVLWFRTLHPEPIFLKPDSPSAPWPMTLTLLLSVVVFMVLYVGFLAQRYALEILQDVREEAASAIS
jgi:heme exporter protein C